jgi:hypothetical protein
MLESLCDAPMAAKNKHAPVKLFCCDRCRMEGYVLRRAKAMVDEIGIVEFNAIFAKVGRLGGFTSLIDRLIRRWVV